MNRDCKEGLRLRRHFEDELRKWGWFAACEKAIEIMPLGHEISGNSSYKFGIQNRCCLVYSRRLITWDAVATIYEKLKTASEESQALEGDELLEGLGSQYAQLEDDASLNQHRHLIDRVGTP